MECVGEIIPGEEFSFVTTGDSMKPDILAGDRLRIRCVDWKDLKIGDIALFKREGKLIAHRIIRRDYSSPVLWEMGDGKMRAYPVAPSDILGKVISVKRDDLTIPLESFSIRLKSRLKARLMFLKYEFFNKYGAIKKRIGWKH